MSIEIRLCDPFHPVFSIEAAALLVECFPHAYSGCADDEIKKMLAPCRIALIATEGNAFIGFIGAIPQYGVIGWELHPLMVKKAYRRKGVGTRLVQRLEQVCAGRGGVTLYLGTDDEFGKTTLGHVDLYSDTYAKIKGIRNLDEHPYEFYQKIGFAITGVIPDANGVGKPDILMAKRIATSLK